MPARAERENIAGAAGVLQAAVEDPGGAGGLYAVVCHPHPLQGGTMDNKVVTSVARALHECGIPSVRFNFRGVGGSAGAFDHGIGETEDALAVADWAARRWPGRGLVAAGFSFGGYIAVNLARQRGAARLITIAPAVQRLAPTLELPTCPWLIVQGDADDVIDPQSVLGWAERIQPRPRIVVLEGVGHFFHGRLHELRDAVIESIRNG